MSHYTDHEERMRRRHQHKHSSLENNILRLEKLKHKFSLASPYYTRMKNPTYVYIRYGEEEEEIHRCMKNHMVRLTLSLSLSHYELVSE